MDVASDSGYHRYSGAGNGSSTVLYDCFPIFLRPTAGRRNICHIDTLQFHVASFYRDITLRPGHPARSYICDDVDCHLYRVTDGAYLLLRLHERRDWFSALLRFPLPVYHVNAGTGSSDKHLPNVSLLGIGGCKFLFINRILLYKTCCNLRFKESIYCHSFCRLGLLDRYPDLRILWRNVRFHSGYSIVGQRWRCHASVSPRIDVRGRCR
ncbi:hypothetical protein IMSAGC022_00048 [Alistipes sp.]|nr:hypothetical protein IMSAGC022_00048 [Alistipes sp.]